MLQIRLSRIPSLEGATGAKSAPADTVTVACPDHLVLADLPVAKSLGSATGASLVKNIGRRSRRQLGERVHFCVRCDFPIAIYGRLSPCDHAFCLDCARSDSICYLCDERIQKIQTIKLMEGIFICAAPHCLKSFLKKTEFESHIHDTHANLLQPNVKKEEGNESEAVSAKQSTASESTARAPPRPVFSPNSGSQVHDNEDKARHLQPRDSQPSRPIIQPAPFFAQFQNYPSEPQPPNFAGPLNSNPVMVPPPFSYPPFPPEGSLLGFPPGPAMGVNFPEGFPRPWNVGPSGAPFEPSSTGQGDYMQNVGVLPSNMPSPYSTNNNVMGAAMGGNNAMEVRDGKGVLAPQPLPFPLLAPPPPLPPHLSQLKGDNFYSGDMGRDGQGFGWQHEKHDSFGNGQG